MGDDSYLSEIRKGLKESVDFFGSQDKFVLEKWVVVEFLTNLSLVFDESELARGDNPPDVLFRDACFEIKEIVDVGRKRHAEYKQAFIRASNATDPSELLEEYSPKDISVEEIYRLIYSEASHLANRKYSVDFRGRIDLLFYVNLKNVMCLIEEPFPDVTPLALLGFRSISFLNGMRSCTFCTRSTESTFLCAKSKVTHRAIL